MELRQMRYVLAIARSSSMTKAAEQINVSQSALSLSLHTLEDELGVKLFVKKGRGLILTEAGELFCRRAADILTGADNLRTALEPYKTEKNSFITLYSDAIDFSTESVALFSRWFPEVRFMQRPCLSNHVPNILRGGEAELVITLADLSNGEFVSQLLFEEPLYAVVPKSSPLADAESCSIRQLAAYPLVTVLSAYALNSLHRSFFYLANVPLQGIVETSGVEIMVHHVSRGHGITFIPESIFRFETEVLHSFNKSAAALPVSEPFCRRSVYMTMLRGHIHNPVMASFMDFLAEAGRLIRKNHIFPVADDFVMREPRALKAKDG